MNVVRPNLHVTLVTTMVLYCLCSTDIFFRSIDSTSVYWKDRQLNVNNNKRGLRGKCKRRGKRIYLEIEIFWWGRTVEVSSAVVSRVLFLSLLYCNLDRIPLEKSTLLLNIINSIINTSAYRKKRKWPYVQVIP